MKTKPRRHHFVDDPAMKDPGTGAQWCMCGLPASNVVHEVAQRGEDEAAYEARRMGEDG